MAKQPYSGASLTPKDLAKIKVMLVYDVRKPLMDEIKEVKERVDGEREGKTVIGVESKLNELP